MHQKYVMLINAFNYQACFVVIWFIKIFINAWIAYLDFEYQLHLYTHNDEILAIKKSMKMICTYLLRNNPRNKSNNVQQITCKYKHTCRVWHSFLVALNFLLVLTFNKMSVKIEINFGSSIFEDCPRIKKLRKSLAVALWEIDKVKQRL